MTPEKSSDYLNRCLETFKADTALSDETKAIMFNQYAKLVNDEQQLPEKEELAILLDDAAVEMDYLYQRLGFTGGSDLLDKVLAKAAYYAPYLPPEDGIIAESAPAAEAELTSSTQPVEQDAIEAAQPEPATNAPEQQAAKPEQPPITEQLPKPPPAPKPIPKQMVQCRYSPTGLHSFVMYANGSFCEFCNSPK